MRLGPYSLRVLITGGHGFIGGRLAKHLVNTGFDVVLGSRCEHNKVEWLPDASTVKIDWADQECLEAACDDVDVIIHASGMNAQDCRNSVERAFEVNALYTAKLMQAAREKQVKRVIYLSTVHVYSNKLFGEITENTLPQNLHPYASSHLAGESIVLDSNQTDNIVLRLSNAFGAPSHTKANCWMLLVNDLCRQVVVDGGMTLKSDASQLRDFITLKDVVASVEHMINISLVDNENNIFNIGGENKLSILEMATIIADRASQLFGGKPVIKQLTKASKRSDNDLNIRIDKLKSTGFNLTKPLQQEVDETLLFCKQHFTT